MTFPNFPDELSEFCWTFLIFHPKIGKDLFFSFSFRSHPLELSEFGSSFRIFRTNFPNFVQLSEFFPNFPDELSEFFDYFPNSRLLSEFWFTFRILAENGPGTGFLGSHFFPTMTSVANKKQYRTWDTEDKNNTTRRKKREDMTDQTYKTQRDWTWE